MNFLKKFSMNIASLMLKLVAVMFIYHFGGDMWEIGAEVLGLKKNLIPSYAFAIVAFLFLFFKSFIWHKILKPALVFLILAPNLYLLLNYLAKFVITQNLTSATIQWTLKGMAISLSLYLATIGFKLLKAAGWKMLYGLFFPIRFFYQNIGEKLLIKIQYYLKYGRADKCPIDLSMAQIDALGNGDTYEKGRMFEEYVAELYRTLGYKAKTTTQLRKEGLLPASIQQRGGSGEQGVDVLVYVPQGVDENNNRLPDKIVAVQCKHYSKKVDNSAVQEINTALTLYKAQKGVVITNNYFTKPAQELAEANGIMLIDRERLPEVIKNAVKAFYLAQGKEAPQPEVKVEAPEEAA